MAGRDADALGLDVPELAAGGSARDVSEDAIWAALATCYDPEIPVNIVELGLIYDLSVAKSPKGARVGVKMTLTAQGCGMGPSIASDAQSRIEALPGVAEARVDVVWDPPWNAAMMSPEAQRRLGMS